MTLAAFVQLVISMADHHSHQLDEEAVLLGVMDRDPNALRTLLESYGPKLKGWLIKRFGPELGDDGVDEVLNNVLAKVWRYADSFKVGRGSLGGWLIQIAQNEARSVISREVAYRAQNRELDPDYDPADPLPSEMNEEAETPTEQSRRRLLADLDDCIEKLARLQQAVIRADLASGDTADEQRLAQLHGSTVNSVRVSRVKARENLQRCMMGKGYDQHGRRTGQ